MPPIATVTEGYGRVPQQSAASSPAFNLKPEPTPPAHLTPQPGYCQVYLQRLSPLIVRPGQQSHRGAPRQRRFPQHRGGYHKFSRSSPQHKRGYQEFSRSSLHTSGKLGFHPGKSTTFAQRTRRPPKVRDPKTMAVIDFSEPPLAFSQSRQ
jgi:hypothetical protein